ncbi:MAG TPA: NAD(P)-binding domain-containing protein [Gemmatimonadales bacterium]
MSNALGGVATKVVDTMNAQHDVYDVIVIGAGWSGLMATKYCLGEGLRTVALESRDTIGGVWAYTAARQYGGVMKTTRTTSSRCVTEMSDFPMPADYPLFPSHDQIRAYLEAYCARFSLSEHIRLNQRVTRVAKRGDLWEVNTGDGSRWLARGVIVSSGLHQYPNDVSGDDRFRGYSGRLTHSAAVKEVPPEWSGKTVVVWGGGESGSDIACGASQVASRTYFCIPRGEWFVPKVVDRWPTTSYRRRSPRWSCVSSIRDRHPRVLDHTSSRLRLWFSPTHHYSPFINEYLEWAFGFNGHGQEAWRTAAPYNRSFFNKSAEVLSRVESGHVIPKRDIASCRGRTVRFTDGTSADVDAIVTCSGYRAEFPFLDESVRAGTDPRNWFKYIFYNDDPSLAFVGFARPIFGSIPGLAELQSRYVAKVFSGGCRLPEPAARRATTRRDARFWNNHFRNTSLRIAGLVDHFVYSDQLAKLMGCYPNFWALFFSSPRKWWQAITAPWSGCQFWLNDVRHHPRIFESFRRHSDDRFIQAHIWLLLAPLLPLIALWRHLQVFFRERLSRNSKTQLSGAANTRPSLRRAGWRRELEVEGSFQ